MPLLDTLTPIVQQDPMGAMVWAIGAIYVLALALAMRY
jgi:hypothetical protein